MVTNRIFSVFAVVDRHHLVLHLAELKVVNEAFEGFFNIYEHEVNDCDTLQALYFVSDSLEYSVSENVSGLQLFKIDDKLLERFEIQKIETVVQNLFWVDVQLFNIFGVFLQHWKVQRWVTDKV